MASLIHEFPVGADERTSWAALADVAAIDKLITFLGPVTLDGDVRVVDMGEHGLIKELVVDVDEEHRRVAYSIRESPYRLDHHHSVMQVLPAAAGEAGSRIVWAIDVKPDSTAAEMAPGVLDAVTAIKASLAQ